MIGQKPGNQSSTLVYMLEIKQLTRYGTVIVKTSWIQAILRTI